MSSTARNKPPASDERRAMIAKLHIARKDLRMQEDDYRAVLTRATGKSSASEMSEQELARALAEFRRLGFKAKAGFKKASNPLARKIYALWAELGEAGALDDPSKEALFAFVKRQAKVDRPEWLKRGDDIAVVEALKAWLRRVAPERLA